MVALRHAIVLLALGVVSADNHDLASFTNAVFGQAMTFLGLRHQKNGEESAQYLYANHKHWHDKMRHKMHEARACHKKCGRDAACHSACTRPLVPFVKACQDFSTIKACHSTCKDAGCEQCPKFEIKWMNTKFAKRSDRLIRKAETRCTMLLNSLRCQKACAPGDHDCFHKCPSFHGRHAGGRRHAKRNGKGHHGHHRFHYDEDSDGQQNENGGSYGDGDVDSEGEGDGDGGGYGDGDDNDYGYGDGDGDDYAYGDGYGDGYDYGDGDGDGYGDGDLYGDGYGDGDVSV